MKGRIIYKAIIELPRFSDKSRYTRTFIVTLDKMNKFRYGIFLYPGEKSKPTNYISSKIFETFPYTLKELKSDDTIKPLFDGLISKEESITIIESRSF